MNQRLYWYGWHPYYRHRVPPLLQQGPSSEYSAPLLVYDEPESSIALLAPLELLVPTDPPIPIDALSSPDEALIPLSLSPLDDHGQYQDLLWRKANLPAEDIKDTHDEFLDILEPISPSRVVLPIHNAVLQPAQAIWQAPASCTPAPKRAE